MAAVARIPTLVSFTAGNLIVPADENANNAAIRNAFNALIGSAGEAYIGDDSNADITIGLTINQGANDDQILALKSSDVAHGLTSIMETDTFAAFSKESAGRGGLLIDCVEDASSGGQVFRVRGYTTVASTSKSAATASGIIELYGAQHNGSNTIQNVTSNGNVLSVRAQVGGGIRSLFVVDAEGDYHYDGADGGAFDEYDDASLVRAFAHATSKDVIRGKWDEFVEYNEADLVEAGILGDTVANGGLVNGAQLQRLLVGTVWQLQTQINEMKAATFGGWLRSFARGLGLLGRAK